MLQENRKKIESISTHRYYVYGKLFQRLLLLVGDWYEHGAWSSSAAKGIEKSNSKIKKGSLKFRIQE